VGMQEVFPAAVGVVTLAQDHRDGFRRPTAPTPHGSLQPHASFQFPWERIARSRTRSAGAGLATRTPPILSGERIASVVLGAIDASVKCATW